jgi:uncharacterized protein
MKNPSELKDAAVTAYLEANPEFFLRHPDLTARLRLRHGPEGTLSLVEHQMGLLRAQAEGEHRLLEQLIARARDYETLASRFHGLMLQLIKAPNQEVLETILGDSLSQEFKAQAVTLVLDDGAQSEQSRDEVQNLATAGIQASTHCGPLDAASAASLFGDAGQGIRSAALIPIRTPTRNGVLAIGSAYPDRFGPDMGLDHLNRLGELVSACLASLHYP